MLSAIAVGVSGLLPMQQVQVNRPAVAPAAGRVAMLSPAQEKKAAQLDELTAMMEDKVPHNCLAPSCPSHFFGTVLGSAHKMITAFPLTSNAISHGLPMMYMGNHQTITKRSKHSWSAVKTRC